MKRFRYRLEPLLTRARQQEEQRQRDLAAAETKVRNQQQRLIELADRKQGTVERMRQQMLSSLSVSALSRSYRHLVITKRDQVTGAEVLRSLQQTAAGARDDLTIAMRERKKYEKLKERQRDRHRTAAEERERKELDELSIQRYRFTRAT